MSVFGNLFGSEDGETALTFGEDEILALSDFEIGGLDLRLELEMDLVSLSIPNSEIYKRGNHQPFIGNCECMLYISTVIIIIKLR